MTDMTTTGSDSRWWIALNVTRTRVTLLGFNLSFVAFLVSLFLAVYKEESFTVHLPGMSALFLAFTFSLLAAGALLTSQELNEAGNSRPWLFSLGDIMMYLALSQSVAGFSRKYLGATIEGVAEIHTTHPGFEGTGSFLQAMMVVLALLAWGLLIYVGPWIAIRRSPLGRGPRRLLVVFYFVALTAIFAVATQAHMLQDVVLEAPEPTWVIFLKQFIQPLTW